MGMHILRHIFSTVASFCTAWWQGKNWIFL